MDENKNWFTDEHLKERKKKPPMTLSAKEAEMFINVMSDAGTKAKKNLEEKISRIGREAYLKESIKELKEQIKKFENPTDEDKWKYSQAYFNEMITSSKSLLNVYLLSFKDLKEGKKEGLIKLNSIVPSTYIIPNTKLNNYLTQIVDYTGLGPVELQVNKKGVLTKVGIDYDDKNINLPKNFTAYDRTVLNASISLYEAGNECFTPDMVYRCMNGLTDKEKPSPQQKGAITKSIDKARRLFCTIDYTEEAKDRNKDVDRCYIEDNILNAKKIVIEAGGNEVDGYKFNTKPVLYQYAQVSGQLISIPVKILNTKSATRSTDDVIVIREYLIRRIEVMKHSKNKHSNKILYKSVYEEIGLDLSIRNQALADKTTKVRNAVKKILEYWQNEKYIKKFQEYKKGKTFEGIEIFY